MMMWKVLIAGHDASHVKKCHLINAEPAVSALLLTIHRDCNIGEVLQSVRTSGGRSHTTPPFAVELFLRALGQAHSDRRSLNLVEGMVVIVELW